MKMISNCAIGNIFIHKKKLTAMARCASVKGNKIPMAQASEDFNFISELLNSLVIVLI